MIFESFYDFSTVDLFFLIGGFIHLSLRNYRLTGFAIILFLFDKIKTTITLELVEKIGELRYFILIILIYLIIFELTKRIKSNLLRNNLNEQDNPYVSIIEHNKRRYVFQFGFYRVTQDPHPACLGLDVTAIKPGGEILHNDYTREIYGNLKLLLEKVQRNDNLALKIIKIPAKMEKNDKSNAARYQEFIVILYSLQLFSANNEEKFDLIDFQAITQFEMSDINYTRERVGQHSNYDIKNYVKFDPADEDVIFQPGQLNQSFAPPTFELGSHEIDIFQNLIRLHNSKITKLAHFTGHYNIGLDINNNPISLDKPANAIYFGNPSRLSKIFEFEFMKKSILVTDDLDLIKSLESNIADIKVLDIRNYFIDILEYFLTNTNLFRNLLSLWERIIPGNLKTGHASSFITPSVVEFLQLMELLEDPEELKTIKPKDLMISKTFREFNKDISLDVFTKFTGILDFDIFNCSKDCLILNSEEFNNHDLTIISVAGLNQREKFTLMILFLVLKDQSYFPNNWISFSLGDEGSSFENHLSKIGDTIDFNEVLINLRRTGHIMGWINQFELALCDSNLENKRVLHHLYAGIPKINNGIYLNYRKNQMSAIRC